MLACVCDPRFFLFRTCTGRRAPTFARVKRQEKEHRKTTTLPFLCLVTPRTAFSLAFNVARVCVCVRGSVCTCFRTCLCIPCRLPVSVRVRMYECCVTRVAFSWSRVYFVRARVTALGRDSISSVPVIAGNPFPFGLLFSSGSPSRLSTRSPLPLSLSFADSLARRKRLAEPPVARRNGERRKENEARRSWPRGHHDHGRRVAASVDTPIRIARGSCTRFLPEYRVESEKRERRLQLSSVETVAAAGLTGLLLFCSLSRVVVVAVVVVASHGVLRGKLAAVPARLVRHDAFHSLFSKIIDRIV